MRYTYYREYEREDDSVSTNTVSDSFFNWISRQVSSVQLSNLFTTLDETEKYCLSKHLIDKQLFEITDPEVIRKLSSSLEGNRFIRAWGYGENRKRIEALRYYTSFLEKYDVKSLGEKNSNIAIEANVISAEDQVMECSWVLGKVDHANFELWLLANEDNSGLRTMVLSVIDSADEYARRNHLNAARLYGVHTRMAATMALNLMMSRKMFQKESPDMASKLKDCGKGYYLPFVKAVLPEGIAVETEKHATTVSGQADQSSTEKNAPQKTWVSPTVENPSSNLPGMNNIALKDRSTLSLRDRFLGWLKDQNYSAYDISLIVDAIEWSEKLAVERQAGAERLFEARDLSDAVSTFSALLSVHSFVEMERKRKGLCSQSIRLLIDMLRQEQGLTVSPRGKMSSDTGKPNNAPRKTRPATNGAPAKPLRTSMPEPPSDKPGRMKTATRPTPQADADLYNLLERENVRYIDMRLYSGKLWIIGGMEHANFILKASKLG